MKKFVNLRNLKIFIGTQQLIKNKQWLCTPNNYKIRISLQVSGVYFYSIYTHSMIHNSDLQHIKFKLLID